MKSSARFSTHDRATGKMRYVTKILKQFDRITSTRFIQNAVYGCAVVGGVVVGAVMAGVSGFASQLLATPDAPMGMVTENAASFKPAGLRLGGSTFETIVVTSETAVVPQFTITSGNPRIAIVIDDMGLNEAALDRILNLPGPLTLSFLPYAPDIQAQVDMAWLEGHAIFLHMPMEATNKLMDAGPRMLSSAHSETEIRRNLAHNLAAFKGYAGVNNHMGSQFTRDYQGMKLVLSELQQRDLYFLDSLTTGRSVGADVARDLGMTIYHRDVFLDADHGAEGAPNVKARLRELEGIARKKGFAIAVAHPYTSTVETLGPWLLSLEERGFDLVTVDQLLGAPAEEPRVLAKLR